MHSRRYPLALAVTGLTLALSGCFSSSSSSSSADTGGSEVSTENVMTSTSELEGEQTGTLQDAPVEGLTYWTASAGVQRTGEGGTFEFEPGEVVSFYLGDKRLMVTDAELITTPIDTLSLRRVEGLEAGGHPSEPINILRLLQAVDDKPDDDQRIVIDEKFHEHGWGEDQKLNLTQETDDFAGDSATGDVLTFGGSGQDRMPSFEEASRHLKNTLESLEGNEFDLRGEWIISTGTTGGFGKDYYENCNLEHRETLIVDDEHIFLTGDELNFEPATDECIEEPYASEDSDSGDLGEIVERDGQIGLQWDVEQEGVPELGCGPICTLTELRTTVNDWDEVCRHDDYDSGSGNTSTDYCDESDEHNGEVVQFSEVTFVDRLGGDRMLRIKRNFDNYGGDEPTERQLEFDVLDRSETVDYSLDLTSGQWKLDLLADGDTATVTEAPSSIDASGNGFAVDEAVPDCADYTACTWAELNDTNAEGAEFIHVRDTDRINFVEGDTVGTLTAVE